MHPILEAYGAYTDHNGLISGERLPLYTSGNALLFTAQKICVLRQHGLLTQELLAETMEFIRSECQVVPGLFRRSRMWKDQEGPDDYLGVACIDPAFAREILSYGRDHTFVWGPFRLPFYFENESPGRMDDKRAWLGRQQQLLAHWQYAAGEPVPFWRKWLWELTIKLTGQTGPDSHMPGGQDSWILSAMLLEVHWDPAIAAHFYAALDREWPGGMRSVFATYFNDLDHPTARFWKERR